MFNENSNIKCYGKIMSKNADEKAPALQSYISASGMRQKDAASLWGVTPMQASRIINCKSSLAPKHAVALCRKIGLPEGEFSRLYNIPADPFYFARHGVEWKGAPVSGSAVAPGMRIILRPISVIGHAQAGVFTEVVEWDEPSRYTVNISQDDGFSPEFTRYGIEVRGESMNKVFPNGSIVSVIDFDELGKKPATGDYVTVLRRDAYGPGFEATIKALQIKDDGTICLWPKSTDPRYQQPLIIPPPRDDRIDDASALDVQIKGLVVGSVSTRPRATF